MGAGIGLEINVVVPARPGKVGEAPREGGTRCHCAQCLAPLQEGGPRVGQGWQELTASAQVPCRPGRGLPRLWCPFWLPRSTSFKPAIWLLPLAPLGREQAQAIEITVLPFNFSDPGSELSLSFQGNLGQTGQCQGVGKPPSTQASLRGPKSPWARVSKLMCHVAAE